MRINDLNVKTIKGDNSLKKNTAINILVKAGFIVIIDNNILYTPIGLKFKNKIKKIIFDKIIYSGYSEIEVPSSDDLKESIDIMNRYLNSAVKSYKDIPFKTYTNIKITNHSSTENSWKFKNREYIIFMNISDESYGKDIQNYIIRKLFKNKENLENNFFYKFNNGLEYKKNVDIKLNKTLNKFLYFNIMIYREKYYGILTLDRKEPSINMVKRYLGITNENIKFLTDKEIDKKFKISKKYLGPVRPVTDYLLIDSNIKPNIPYTSGSNIDGEVKRNIYLDKDFTGYIADFTYNEEVDYKGYYIGGTIKDNIKYRTTNKKGKFSYYNVNNFYIDVDRLVLSIAESSISENNLGLNFKKELNLFNYVITFLDYREDNSVSKSDDLYREILNYRSDILFDNRNISIGKKYRDYDLMSIPFRIILKDNNLYNNLVEMRDRYGNIKLIDKEILINNIKDRI